MSLSKASEGLYDKLQKAQPSDLEDRSHVPPCYISSLPTEVFGLVIEHFAESGTRRVHPLLFVCRFFHREAERILYGHITLTARMDLDRQVDVLSRLQSCDRVSGFVRSLDLHAPLNRNDSMGPYWEILQRTFMCLHNLQFLVIRLLGLFRHHAPSITLFQHCPFRLRSLIIYGSRVSKVSAIFLMEQTEIEELVLRESINAQFDMATSFPKLKILEVAEEAGTNPLVGRTSLRALRVFGTKYFTFMQSGITSLRILHWQGVFERLVNNFPFLRYIRVDNWWIASGEDAMSEIKPLRRLRHLQKLRLHIPHFVAGRNNRDLARDILICIPSDLPVMVLQFRAEPRVKWLKDSAVEVPDGMEDDEDEWKDSRWW